MFSAILRSMTQILKFRGAYVQKISNVALMTIMPALTLAADFVAGKDYKVLTTKGQVEKAGMIEVREFFWLLRRYYDR